MDYESLLPRHPVVTTPHWFPLVSHLLCCMCGYRWQVSCIKLLLIFLFSNHLLQLQALLHPIISEHYEQVMMIQRVSWLVPSILVEKCNIWKYQLIALKRNAPTELYGPYIWGRRPHGWTLPCLAGCSQVIVHCSFPFHYTSIICK